METKRYISEYENFIIKFENALKEKYQITDSIYNYIDGLIKKSDSLNDYQYNFHGAGCRVTSDNIICEYDFLLDDNSKYQFSLWKLKTFIESSYKIDIDNIELKRSLEDLVLRNHLKKLIIEGRIFDVYLI